jgi:hypothetical protein
MSAQPKRASADTIEKVSRLMDANIRDYGTIHYKATNGDGTTAVIGSTTTFHPHDEMHVMSAALEIERAVRRGVRVPPHAIGALIVMAPDAPLLEVLRRWGRARRDALAKREKWQAWLIERGGSLDTGLSGPFTVGSWARKCAWIAAGVAGVVITICAFAIAGGALWFHFAR